MTKTFHSIKGCFSNNNNATEWIHLLRRLGSSHSIKMCHTRTRIQFSVTRQKYPAAQSSMMTNHSAIPYDNDGFVHVDQWIQNPKQRNSSAYLYYSFVLGFLANQPKTLDCHNRNFIDADRKKKDSDENMTTSFRNRHTGLSFKSVFSGKRKKNTHKHKKWNDNNNNKLELLFTGFSAVNIFNFSFFFIVTRDGFSELKNSFRPKMSVFSTQKLKKYCISGEFDVCAGFINILKMIRTKKCWFFCTATVVNKSQNQKEKCEEWTKPEAEN